MPEPRPTRQMVNMEVFETSGVDHPAHGYEGWLVQKSAGPGRMARLETLMKGTDMPTEKEALLKEIADSDAPDDVKASFTKAIDLTAEMDTVAQLWRDLREKQEAGDPDVPSVNADGTPVVDPAAVIDPLAATAPPAPAPAQQPVLAAADMFGKSLTAAEQEALNKSLEENPAMAKAFEVLLEDRRVALEKAAKEESDRLDAEAVELSKAAYPQVGIDHAEVAPKLRLLKASDPATAAMVEDVLAKANAQLESAGMFAEIGTRQTAAAMGEAMTKATVIADALVSAGSVKSRAEGLAKAFKDNPDLYDQHEKEKTDGR